MKVSRIILIATIFSLGVFTSCTPESTLDDNTEQQIDKNIDIPRQG